MSLNLSTMLERNRAEQNTARRARYIEIVVAVADRVAKVPLSTNESFASRLTPAEVAELMTIFDETRKAPASFEADVAGVANVREAQRRHAAAQVALEATQPVEETASALVVERLIEDAVVDAARLPVTELEAAERRRRSAEAALDAAESAVRGTRSALSELMGGWNES